MCFIIACLSAGMVESWRRAGQDYFSDLHSNYFSDLITLYSALGLAVQFKSAVALASLVSTHQGLFYMLTCCCHVISMFRCACFYSYCPMFELSKCNNLHCYCPVFELSKCNNLHCFCPMF